jgi:hypothetical protein
MNVGETCNRIVVFAHPEESVREAAQRMRSADCRWSTEPAHWWGS